MFPGLRYIAAMADIIDIGVIDRQIDEELAKAKAKYGPRHLDLIVLGGSRGDTISDADLLRRLRALNRTGSFYSVVLKQVAPEE